MTHWTFVRHGESVANAEGRFAGHRDVPLTEEGTLQARQLGIELAGFVFERVLVSDLIRARRTLELALPDRPHQVLPGLRERSLGTWEGLDRSAVRALGGFDVLLEWDGHPPGGESLTDLLRRVLETLVPLDDGKHTLVVCHGGVMRVVLGALDRLEAHQATRASYANCAVETRDVPTGTWARLLAAL